MKITISGGDFYHRGTYQVPGGFHMTIPLHGEKTNGVELFVWDDNKGLLPATRQVVEFPAEYKRGDLYAVRLSFDQKDKVYAYRYLEDQKPFMDPYAVEVVRTRKKGVTDTYGLLRRSSYHWGKDTCPRIPFEKCVLYGLHVKGFTMDQSSGVAAPGTFSGIAQKIPYLKKLGVTSIVMQPAYDFAPIMMRPVSGELTENYWGYTDGQYFAPNKRFASRADAAQELKDMVRAFHRNGMEVIMQLGFPRGVSIDFLSDILFYWKENFHMDGFSFVGSQIPVEGLLNKDFLTDTKLIAQNLGDLFADHLPGRSRNPYLAEYRLDFMNVARKFLKGDEDMVQAFLYQNRQIPDHYHLIHYLADFNTFRLMDLVSYERKHNETNGEDNKDGENYNNSWNCGAEGDTKKTAIRKLRLKQLKNAACLLLLSQGTPYIFMGDEFGDTSFGNNNPYNQDNEISYVDWNAAKKNRVYASFFRQLLKLKKETGILNRTEALKQTALSGNDIPELSYHGEALWRPNMDSYIRHIAVMLSDRDKDTGKKTVYYMAYNMHWEEHAFSLPDLPGKQEWKLFFTTESAFSRGCAVEALPVIAQNEETSLSDKSRKNKQDKKRILSYTAKIAPRSIAVFIRE